MNLPAKNISETRGTWCAVVSCLLYGLLGYFGVTLMKSGFSAYNAGFWRFATGALFLLLFVIVKRAYPIGLLRQCVLTLVNDAIFHGAPGILFFLSSSYIGTGQAMVIFFIVPSLGEKPRASSPSLQLLILGNVALPLNKLS